jgi:hypothetical protein
VGHVLKAAGFAAAIALVAAGPAGASPSFTGTLETPEAFSWPSTTSLTYYLRMAAGPSDEVFSVRLTPPRYGVRSPIDEGESIDGPRAVALQGPGVIGQIETEPRFIEPCSAFRDRTPGYATGAETVDVFLPANSNTTLAARYAAGATAPRAATDYRLRFTALPRLTGDYGVGSPFAGRTPSFTRPISLTTSPIRIEGRTAVKVILATSPRAGAGPGAQPGTVPVHHRVTIFGRLLPARRGLRVEIGEVAGRAEGRLRRVARVMTDARGRFRYRGWRPSAIGLHEVWAHAPAQGDVAESWVSCPRRLRVTG